MTEYRHGFWRRVFYVGSTGSWSASVCALSALVSLLSCSIAFGGRIQVSTGFLPVDYSSSDNFPYAETSGRACVDPPGDSVFEDPDGACTGALRVLTFENNAAEISNLWGSAVAQLDSWDSEGNKEVSALALSNPFSHRASVKSCV